MKTKKIKSFSDIDYIITHKIDICDDLKQPIPFLKLLMMKLIDVCTIIENGEYTYDIIY